MIEKKAIGLITQLEKNRALYLFLQDHYRIILKKFNSSHQMTDSKDKTTTRTILMKTLSALFLTVLFLGCLSCKPLDLGERGPFGRGDRGGSRFKDGVPEFKKALILMS